MFNKERSDLEKISLEFKFSRYHVLIEQRKKLESDISDIHSKVDALEGQAKEYARELNTPAYVLEFANNVKVRAMFETLKDWTAKYDVYVGLKNEKPKLFAENNTAEKLKGLSSYNDKFRKYLDNESDFVKAVTFVNGFNALGKLTEDTVQKKHDYLKGKTLSKIEKHIPAEVKKEIEDVNTMFSTIKNVQDYYADITSYLARWEFLYNTPHEESLFRTYLREFSSLISGCDRGEELLKQFAELKGDRNLKIFAKYEKEYKVKLDNMVKALKNFRKEVNNFSAENRRRRKSTAVVFHIIFWTFMAMIAAVVVTTIIRTIVDFWAGIPPFWAILFGLIVGALFSVIRLISLIGMGSIWWPESVSTLIYPESSDEISTLMVCLNAAFVAVAVLYIFYDMYFGAKYGGGFITDYGLIAYEFLMLIIAGLVIRILWSGIAGLVEIWNIWPPIEVLCGIFFGLFRLIMLIFGAGFWWPGLFSCTGDAGAILNASFYIVIAVAIVITVIIVKMEEKSWSKN